MAGGLLHLGHKECKEVGHVSPRKSPELRHCGSLHQSIRNHWTHREAVHSAMVTQPWMWQVCNKNPGYYFRSVLPLKVPTKDPSVWGQESTLCTEVRITNSTGWKSPKSSSLWRWANRGCTNRVTQLQTRPLVHHDLGLIIQPCLPEAFATMGGEGKATNPWDFSKLFFFFF